METEAEFLRIYTLPGLRQFLIDTIRVFTKDEELQEELLQEAWCKIWLADEEQGCEYYQREGYRAIDAAYRKDLRLRRLTTQAIHKRLYRRRKKLVEKVSKKVR